MSVRHVHARRGEHVVVHRDKDPGCLEIIVGIIILVVFCSLLKGC